jgi:hypothetical protein
MSARARKPPTTEPPDRPSLEDQPTTIYDSDELPARRRAQSPAIATVVDRPAVPAGRPASTAPVASHPTPTIRDQPVGSQPTPTIVDKPIVASKAGPTVRDKPAARSNAGPTVVDRPMQGARGAPTVPAKPMPAAAKPQHAAPIQVISKKEASSPIQAISMKTPGDGQQRAAPDNPPTPMLARPKLRAVSEVSPAQQQQNLGNLASPYDPKAARARAMREYVIYGCLAVILASGIALVVWFVAR